VFSLIVESRKTERIMIFRRFKCILLVQVKQSMQKQLVIDVWQVHDMEKLKIRLYKWYTWATRLYCKVLQKKNKKINISMWMFYLSNHNHEGILGEGKCLLSRSIQNSVTYTC
jgi:hypothetical protein